MHVYYTRIICLLVEDVDIIISFSSSNLYIIIHVAIVCYEHSVILCCVIIIIEIWIYSIIASSKVWPLRDCETVTSSWC